jgi:MOSC domain-containing protein YiiM
MCAEQHPRTFASPDSDRRGARVYRAAMDFHRRFAVLVERLAGIDLGRLDDSRPMAHLGERLARVNLGLLPVAEPERFAWPGHWIAVVDGPGGDREPIVMFGVPSGALAADGAALLERGGIVEGYVIAPLDLDRPHGAAAYAGATGSGVVTGIFTAPESGAACIAHDERRLVAGVGLEGDRYATGRGKFSAPGRGGQALTLIAEEAISAARAKGAEIDAATARRNVVTRGIELEPLIGGRFMIGTATCRATRLAEPCAHLERLTVPGVLRAMVHLGGIRADVITDGAIRVGDALRPIPEPGQEAAATVSRASRSPAAGR